MNRNVESHFSMLPSADIDRSRFDRSQDVKFTFNVGELIPFYVDEVLPGDTFDITTSKVVRLQTLLTPVMDNIYLDTYWFFVPNRLVWTHWRELMGENTDSAWLPEVTYSVPQIYLQDSYGAGAVEGDGKVGVGDILDYMGIPVGISHAGAATGHPTNTPHFTALPLRGYQLIFNEWFRDENLVDPVNIQKGDTSYNYYDSDYVPHDPYLVSKYHDYFTSALPAPQKGPTVKAGVSDTGSGYRLGVYSVNLAHDLDWPGTVNQKAPLSGMYKVTISGENANTYGRFYGAGSSWDTSANAINEPTFANNADPSKSNANNMANGTGFYPDNLYAWARPDQWSLALDINDLRYAFQLQKLYERDARGGKISCLHVKKIEEKIWKAA